MTRISLPRSLDHACDAPLASADYSCDCDVPFVRVAATHYHQPSPSQRFRPQLAAYNWCKQLAAVEVVVEEVSFRFAVVVAVGLVVVPSHSPLDSMDCRDASSPTVPCFDCSNPSGRKADIAGMAACWPDCDGFVCNGAFVRPCHRPSGSDHACLSSYRNS